MQRLLLPFTLLVWLVCPVIAPAQALFGIKAGLNASTIGGDAQGISTKLGFHLGAYMTGKLSERAQFQPEFVYSVQGAQASTNSDVKFHYNYFNVPMVFKLFPSEHFFFQAGPQIGFLVSANATNGRSDVSIKSQLNSVDYSLALGIGGDFADGLQLSARYNLGLNSTASSSNYANNSLSYPNRVFQLSLGYTFGK